MSRALVSLILALAIGLGNACVCAAAHASTAVHHRPCCEHSSHPATPAHHCSHCDGTTPPAQAASAKLIVEPPADLVLLLFPIDIALVHSQVSSPAFFHYGGLPPPAIDLTLLDLGCALNI